MDQVMRNDILKSIKSDDLVLFSTLTKGKNNLCFGRFPLLTLCYLYNAKKIIKRNFKFLCKIQIYEFVPEPFEVYRDFKMVAGRLLRFYTKEKALVSPAEMLAILHKDLTLKKVFKEFSQTDQMTKNLNKIYNIYGQKVEINAQKIKISLPKLTRSQKIACVLGIIFGLVLMCSTAGAYGVSVYTLGMGTASLPYKISSEGRFYQALRSTSGNYVLTRDIEIDNPSTQLEFSGDFDGNNHTIYIKNIPNSSFISKNTGTIKNLNIVYSDITSEVSSSLSLFIGDNAGIVNNVNITCESLNINFIKSNEQDLYFGAFAINNSGVIDSCNLNLSSNFVGTGDGECLVGGIAGTNSKEIKNCIFENGSIVTDTIDVAGIVALNNVNSIIEGCKNNANIKQTSSLNGWSPNASGICFMNNGSIKNAINSGTIMVESLYEGDDASGSVNVSGISANNLGEIIKSLNKGEIKANSKDFIVYAGGITAITECIYDSYGRRIWSEVGNCGNQGDVNISTSGEKAYAFVGGISGAVYYSYISNCYSIASFENGYNEGKYCVGTFIGTVDQESGYLCLDADDIYVEGKDNIPCQIGSVLYKLYVNGVLSQITIGEGINIVDIIFTKTAEEIRAQEVYWDE